MIRAVRAAVATSLVLSACRGGEHARSTRYDVTARYPHDPGAYTEGLVTGDGVLFESTGLNAGSDVRRVDLKTGRVLASRALAADRFGEGLTLLHGRLYQLTWKDSVAYTYDPATLTPGDSFHYGGEGWGLTTDGTNLIMSDGSDSLRMYSPAFELERVIHVRYHDTPLQQVNELEYVNGEILANVYRTNWVMRIDPSSGVAREAIDFGDLYPNRPVSADVMNGIAIAPDGQQVLLTGKQWPTLFQVRLHPAAAAAR